MDKVCFEALACVFASADARKEAIRGEVLLIVYQLFNIFLSHGKEVEGNVLGDSLSIRYVSHPKNKLYRDLRMQAPQLANTPGQLLKKVAQATPKGLLHLFVLFTMHTFLFSISFGH